MRSIFKAFPFLIVVLWIMGGTALVYYMTNTYRDNGSLFQTKKELLIKDGQFEIILSKPIRYAPKQSEATLTRELNDALISLADHLIEEPTKKLLITGYYTLEEEKLSEMKGVGRLRAENLKGHLIALGADPGNIFISAELDSEIKPNTRSFKGVSFVIINEDNKKLNTSPIIESIGSDMTSYTTIILPYYTSQFYNLDDLNEELNGYIESVLENENMALAIEIEGENHRARVLLNLLYEYVAELTDGVNIPITKEIIIPQAVSDRAKQNMKIDIGIKRFQNNLEL